MRLTAQARGDRGAGAPSLMLLLQLAPLLLSLWGCTATSTSALLPS